MNTNQWDIISLTALIFIGILALGIGLVLGLYQIDYYNL